MTSGPVSASAPPPPPPPGPVEVPKQPEPPAFSDLKLPELFAPVKPQGAGVSRLEPQPQIKDFDTVIFVDGAGPPGNKKGPGPASAAIVVYTTSAGTVECHTHHDIGTNNLMEHIGYLAALRRAVGKTLIINDSYLAHAQVHGINKVNEPHLQAIVNDSRPMLESKTHSTTFAHMHGHKGSVPNHADPQCTWARTYQACTGDPALFLHSASASKAANGPIDTRNWLPSSLNTLTQEQINNFWLERPLGDRFSIWWSLAEVPNEQVVWTGIKLTNDSVNYIGDDGVQTKTPWPPAPNVRVHSLRLLAGGTRKGTKSRPHHVVPHTVVECDLEQTNELFKTFGTEQWVKWCIANPARRTLPTSHWFAWASIVKRFIQACNAASDDEQFADAALIFLGLPNLFLSRKMKNRPLGEALERHTMSRRLDGTAPKYQDAIDPEEKSIRQAQTLAEQGFIGKACKAIGTNRVLDGSLKAVQVVLEAKHPSGTFFMPDAPLQTMPFHGEAVQRVIMKLANGSAPCWSGWTKELVNAACRTDPDIFHFFAVFLSKVRVSPDLRLAELLRTGKLIALNNARSPSDPDDPRPITISELFSKLLGLLAMEQSRWCIHPTQRGVNHKGGTHQTIVEIQRAYDADPTKIVATFDVSNAFNATMRQAIKNKLQRIGMPSQDLLDYFRWMYGSQSDIYIRASDELIKYRSCEGVRQGDMPASLLFSLVFTDAAVAAAESSFGTGSTLDVLRAMWLYLDDVTVVETVAAILRFKIALEKELEDIGLRLNMLKCRALADRCSAAELKALVDAGFQIDYGCTRSLGSPIGGEAACRIWVLAKVEKWQPFWEKVRHNLLAPFTAMLILSKCGNVKFHHLAKSLPPKVCRDAAIIFDGMVDDSCDAILGRRLGDVDLYTRRALACLAPYAVTCAALYENTCKMLDGERIDDKIAVHHAIVSHYEKLPSSPFVGPLICAVQGVTAADTFQPTTTLTDATAVNGLLLRHGVAPRHLPSICSCGYFFGKLPVGVEAIHHLMHCRDNVSKTHTTRHHEVVHAIQNVLHLYGICSVWENSKLHPTLRPDLHITTPVRQVIIDVTVIDDVYTGDPDALQLASVEKHGHYDALADALKMDFFAVPLSSYGKLHSESHRFIDRIAMKCVNQFRRRQFKRDMRSAIQHALLKGTSDVVDAAVSRLSGRFADWVE